MILLSTHHHSKEVDVTQNNKPEIINAYNEDKGGVDVYNQLINGSSTRRKTNRWTMNSFFFIIDCAVQNAFALIELKNESANPQIGEKVLVREDYLTTLGKSLILENVKDRYKKFEVVNFKHSKFSIINAMRRLIPSVINFQVIFMKFDIFV